MTAPELSVVVTTTHSWPAVEACLERLVPQTFALGAELILADASEQGLPDPCPESYRHVRWLRAPGASVFELRALATAAAGGGIIAWTEDHCLVNSDWCRRHLAAHREKPGMTAVAGAVVNGSTGCRLDWANYFLTNGQFLPPIGARRITRAPGVANVSFWRWTNHGASVEPGWVELVLQPRLLAAGRIVFDDRLQVTHVQSHGMIDTCAAHFHNGRSTAGLAAQRMTRVSRLFRLPFRFLMPVVMVFSGGRVPVQTPGFRRLLVASLPWMSWLAVCHSAGQIAGLVAGAGSSPRRIE